MKFPLVVIDMQDYFLSRFEDRETLISNVVRAVERAKRFHQPVLLVEYSLFSPSLACTDEEARTTKAIRDAVAGYPFVDIVTKPRDNGGREVAQWFRTNMPHGLLKVDYTVNVCGVNLDACVWQTCHGLMRQGFKPRVIREASCNCWCRTYEPIKGFDWSRQNGIPVRSLRYA